MNHEHHKNITCRHGITTLEVFHYLAIMKADEDFTNPEYIVKIILLLITIPFGICGNILVVLALWKKRSLRTTTNFLLLNLAISDLITLVFGSLMAVPELTTLKESVSSDVLCIFFVHTMFP